MNGQILDDILLEQHAKGGITSPLVGFIKSMLKPKNSHGPYVIENDTAAALGVMIGSFSTFHGSEADAGTDKVMLAMIAEARAIATWLNSILH